MRLQGVFHMRRLWNTLDTVLKNTRDRDKPCFPAKRTGPGTGPVMVRLASGRIALAGPGSKVSWCPPLSAGSCLLAHREADENVTIWMGLPPCATGSEIAVLFKRDGFCRNNLITMTRLAGHLEEGEDVREILAELEVVRSRIERFLQMFFKCGAPCPALKKQALPKDMLVLGLAGREEAERMAGRFMERFSCSGASAENAGDAALEALAARGGRDGAIMEAGPGGSLGAAFNSCETLPAASWQEKPVPVPEMRHYCPVAGRSGLDRMHGYRERQA